MVHGIVVKMGYDSMCVELWMPWLICTTVHELKRSCGIMDFMILGHGMDGQGKKALDMFSPMWFRFW